jgi:hypothetical protein
MSSFGRLVWVESELGWRADGQLAWEGAHRVRIHGITFDAAFRTGMEGSAQILSGHGEP